MKKRFLTRSVNVGSVSIGGRNPVRIQSMLSVSILDEKKALEQSLKLSDAGCELLRIAIPGIKEALAVEKFKNLFVQKNVNMPLIADIHFCPKAALTVADFVEKVRINPGNYLDKKAAFPVASYTPEQYREELVRLEEGFLPLLEKLKKQGKALRIGVNHGSLSDRIMSHFGNTAEGMVESAREYAEICRKHDFHNLVFSMKASDPLIMVESYLKLLEQMQKNGWDYPLHLGVTEAGEGEDGRVKSAVGMGALLLDGIGDTIRVSLTEDPEKEIRPAGILADYAVSNREKFQKFLGREHSLPDKNIRKLDLASLLHFPGDREKITVEASAAWGFLALNKISQNVLIPTEDMTEVENADLKAAILQALNLKKSKAEFISCPGCGRTQFDIQKITRKVKARMSHLKGVKIAVMGCVVNGPGEMADSDFGIVGAGKGRVNLYLKKQCVEKDIDLDRAENKLIELIKKAGRWTDPEPHLWQRGQKNAVL